jgi:hypothetical protein
MYDHHARLQANEVFNGRLAMLGFLAAVLQQLRLGGYSGPGPIAQVGGVGRGGRGPCGADVDYPCEPQDKENTSFVWPS